MTIYHRACRFDPEIEGRTIWELTNDGHRWNLSIWTMEGNVAWEGQKLLGTSSTDMINAEGVYENIGGEMSWPTEREITITI